jgi:hypothetical protein
MHIFDEIWATPLADKSKACILRFLKPGMHKSLVPGGPGDKIWYVGANIFSIITVIISLYATVRSTEKRKRQIMARFSGDSGNVGSQYGTWFLSPLCCQFWEDAPIFLDNS